MAKGTNSQTRKHAKLFDLWRQPALSGDAQAAPACAGLRYLEDDTAHVLIARAQRSFRRSAEMAKRPTKHVRAASGMRPQPVR